MGKFVIACPNPECNNYVTAYNGFKGFFRRKTTCPKCKTIIDVKSERMKSRVCPYCHNTFVYDQAEKNVVCPVCRKILPSEEGMTAVQCPKCGFTSLVDVKNFEEDNPYWICPLCDERIDKGQIKKQLRSENAIKEGQISVVEFAEDPNILIWKHKSGDFPNGSQLIVREGQEAIFLKDGRALDTFPSGRYTLDTHTLPKIKAMYGLRDDDPDVSFHSDVYFVSLSTVSNIEWGTPEKIKLIDPFTQIPISIGAGGSYRIRITDSRRVLVKMVGTTSCLLASRPMQGSGTLIVDGIDLSKVPTVGDYFRETIVNCVKSNLPGIIKREQINLMEIDERAGDISRELCNVINEELEEYGVTIPQFYVNRFVTPEEDEDDPDARDAYLRLKKLYQTRKADSFAHTLEREKVHETHSDNEEDREWERKILQEDKEIARQDRMADLQAGADEEIYKARVEAEKMKIQSGSDIETKKAYAAGNADMTRIEAQANADKTYLEAEADAAALRMRGQAEADVYSAKASAQAMEMKQKGYTYQDLASHEYSMKALDKEIVAEEKSKAAFDNNESESTWDCIVCGEKGLTSNFCPKCGNKKPEQDKDIFWNCECGARGLTSDWCPVCGRKRPEIWDCVCGAKGLTSKCCPECGRRRPERWDCSCGAKGLTSKCCPNCGRPRPESWIERFSEETKAY